MTEIVVVGERLGSLRPQRSVGGDDLLAYGAGTVSELLDEVAAENGDGRATLTILVNGRRVAGLGDIDTYPAEAIERVDILPRESGAAAGAPAGSRVYNVVLKRETHLAAVRGRARATTDGAAKGGTFDVSATRIRRPQRLNAALLVRRDNALFESDRRVTQPAGSPLDLGRSRTLRPASNGSELSLSAADQLLPWLDGLVTFKIRESRSAAALGLSEARRTIKRSSRTRNGELTAQLNAERGSWLITLEGSSRRDRRRTATGFDDLTRRIAARTSSDHLDLLVHGPLAQLPAGPLHLTLGAAIHRDSIQSRGSGGASIRFGRTSREARVGVDVPISSRAGPLPWLGDLAIRAEIIGGETGQSGVRGRTLSLRWSPAQWLQLSALHNRSRTVPGVDLLGEPLLETSGVRYLDPLRMETLDLVAVTGGQLDLPSQSTATRRMTVDVRPLQSVDLLLTAEYSGARYANVVSVLPPPTNLVLQLFPDRFQRDSSGRLVRVDLRPVVFPGQREEQIRIGVNLNLPLRKGSGGPRLQVSGSYRHLLGSRLGLPDGFGTVDLLDRDSIAPGGAMRPRHQFDFTLAYSERGLGMRLNGERRSQSFLGAAGQSDILTFEPLTSFSLRGFVEGSRVAPNSPLLQSSRISLSVNNLTNTRERVRDGLGITPLAYQPALRDPVGRSIEVEFRKTF